MFRIRRVQLHWASLVANPLLLIFDGHATHSKNIAVNDLARQNGVTLLVLPPHCSHRLKLLDVAFMKPLNTYYNLSTGVWNRTKNSKNWTEPTSKFKKPKTRFPWFGFKNQLPRFVEGFHVVSFTIHLAAWQDQQSQYFSSCRISAPVSLHSVSLATPCISALLILSHFGWQLVGAIQHGSTLFLASYTLNNTQCKKLNQNLKPRLI